MYAPLYLRASPRHCKYLRQKYGWSRRTPEMCRSVSCPRRWRFHLTLFCCAQIERPNTAVLYTDGSRVFLYHQSLYRRTYVSTLLTANFVSEHKNLHSPAWLRPLDLDMKYGLWKSGPTPVRPRNVLQPRWGQVVSNPSGPGGQPRTGLSLNSQSN